METSQRQSRSGARGRGSTGARWARTWPRGIGRVDRHGGPGVRRDRRRDGGDAGPLTDWWLYLVGPIVGGVVAAVVYDRFVRKAASP
jgi:hypothetical protein